MRDWVKGVTLKPEPSQRGGQQGGTMRIKTGRDHPTTDPLRSSTGGSKEAHSEVGNKGVEKKNMKVHLGD